MVRYEMQRRESTCQPSDEGTMACVGHASMQRVQVPQRSGGGAPGSRSSDVTISPRKNHDPSGSLIRQVFLPIQPKPGQAREGALQQRRRIDADLPVKRFDVPSSRATIRSSAARIVT